MGPVAGEQESTGSARERRVVAVGILGTGAFVLAQTAAQLVNYRLFALRLDVINSDRDGGVFGIVCVLALFWASAAWC